VRGVQGGEAFHEARVENSMRAETQTVDPAKPFLPSKALEQARRDLVPAAEIEKRMLLFSEPSASDRDLQVRREFDAECDDQPYEAKITGPFRRAYAHARRTVDENSCQEALDALRAADLYALAMVDQAGIPRAKSYPPVLSAFDSEDALLAVFAAGVLAAGFVIVFDPPGWVGSIPGGSYSL
jgi:hypothetical protein